MWKFSVADNGIGIAPEYQQRIFGLFKRLHSVQQYPGTGIGLAIAQKIVNRCGEISGSSLNSAGAPYFSSPCPLDEIP